MKYHVATIRQLNQFKEGTVQTKKLNNGIVIAMGKFDDSDALTLNEYRFPANSFSLEDAKKFLASGSIKYQQLKEVNIKEDGEQEMKINVKTLIESVNYTGRVDRENNTINGVLLVGIGESVNKIQESQSKRKFAYTYPESTLMEAAPKYEGVPVYIDHLQEGKTRRNLGSKFGKVVNARFKEGKGVLGDIRFNPKHVLAEQILWAAENMPDELGCSHTANGNIGRNSSGLFVESIISVASVDLVAESATTTTLFEGVIADTIKAEDENNKLFRVVNTAVELMYKELYSDNDEAARVDTIMTLAKDLVKEANKYAKKFRESKEMEFKDIQIDDLKKERPDLVEAIAAGDKTELEELRAKVALADREKLVESKLTEAELPGKAVTDTFRKSLIEARDEEHITRLIEDRKELVKLNDSPESKDGESFEEGKKKTKVEDGSFKRAILG